MGIFYYSLYNNTKKNLLINETIPISFQIKGRKIKHLCFIYGKSKIPGKYVL